MKKVKGFNYDTEQDKAIIAHIDKQPNKSQYIWSLVEKDMKQNSIEEIIRQQVEKYLAKVNVQKIDKPIEIDPIEVMDIIKM